MKPPAKVLLVRVDLLTETLSGKQMPQHCRDFKIVNSARLAIERWLSCGYAILGFSDRYKNSREKDFFARAIEELNYLLYCFPPLESVYFAIEGEVCKLNAAGVCPVGVASLLECAIDSISSQYAVTDRTGIWVTSDREADAEIAASMGVNFLVADIWRSTSVEFVGRTIELTGAG
ncbi:MAG: hypothetical protein HC786_30095 [Richelia sp. CSU_2_1]|nr:hypothetical protein [Microcoleus sp. SU_5_6]NJR26056.1 hypothetical protein [Richelia sp. CSU_2_1]